MELNVVDNVNLFRFFNADFSPTEFRVLGLDCKGDKIFLYTKRHLATDQCWSIFTDNLVGSFVLYLINCRFPAQTLTLLFSCMKVQHWSYAYRILAELLITYYKKYDKVAGSLLFSLCEDEPGRYTYMGISLKVCSDSHSKLYTPFFTIWSY